MSTPSMIANMYLPISIIICNALALGIPAQVVMKWTGHSDYKAMKPYIDIADDVKANAMSKFNQL